MEWFTDMYESDYKAGEPFKFVDSPGTEALVAKDSLADIEDLDPSIELSCDLQELIDKAAEGEQELGLFPELLQHPGVGDNRVGSPCMPTINLKEESMHTGGATEPGCAHPLPDIKEEAVEESAVVNYNTADIPLTIRQEDLPEFLTALPTGYSLVDLGVIVDSATTVNEVSSSTGASNLEGVNNVADLPTEENYAHGKITLKAPKHASQTVCRSRKKSYDKDSDDYRLRRDKNNVAVRRSRDKAKQRQLETEERVQGLTEENQQLHKKIDLLTKELTVLKGLFTNVGVKVPSEVKKFISS